MALEETSGIPATMLVSPSGNNSGFGNGFGGDWAWIILLLVLCGGWGNGFGAGGFGGGLGYDFPWLLNGQQSVNNNVSGGFRDAMINDGITSIRDGINGLSTQLCNGFSQAEIAANSRQMADMNQMFSLQSALQNCCCENRAGLADLRYTVATEACADRAAVNDALRDVLAANTASTQRILDQLCQDKIDAKNDTIAQLRSQINELSRTASQNAQTAAIIANNEAQTTMLERYLAPTPIPAYMVANPNCCQSACGCGA